MSTDVCISIATLTFLTETVLHLIENGGRLNGDSLWANDMESCVYVSDCYHIRFLYLTLSP